MAIRIPVGKFSLNVRERDAHPLNHIQSVGGGQHEDAHKRGHASGKAHVRIIVLGAKLNIGDIPETHDRPVLLLDHQLLEFFGGLQIRISDQVDGHHGPFGLTHARQVVIVLQGILDVGRRNVQGRHPVRFHPDPHGKSPGAENLGALDTIDGRQFRLNHSSQVVRDLIAAQVIGKEAEIHRGELVVRRSNLQHRQLRGGRQLVPNLLNLRLDLCQSRIRIVIQFQVDTDRARPLLAGRLHVVDPIRTGDRLFQGRSQKTSHQIRVRAVVDCRDGDHRQIAPRILANIDAANRLVPGDENNQIDDRRHDRPL